jgi:hypothetical protein
VNDLYHDLKGQYFHSIELHGAEDRFTGNTEGNSFVAHALCSYIHTEEPLTSSDSLLPYFYENTTPDTAGSAAWQLWRWADQEPEFRERWPDIRALWEWRLDESSDDYEAHSKEFGWFVKWLDLIPEEVEPTAIKSMLQRTTPILVYNRRGWKTLEVYLTRWADNNPRCCIEIYAKLLRQGHIPDHMEFEDEAMTILETALEAGGDARDLALEVTEMVAEYDQTFLDLLREHSVN